MKSLSLGIPIGINYLGVGDLAALPGIGSELVSRIVRFRNDNDRFQNVEEILLVEGIVEKKLSLIKP